MRRRILHADSVDGKFDQLELILGRLIGRPNNVTIGIPPFSVFSFYCDEVPANGILFRTMIPCKGVISDISLYIEKKLSDDAVLYKVTSTGVNSSRTVSFSTNGKFILHNEDFEVNPGDRIVLSVDESVISGIWVSMVYRIDKELLKTQEFLQESLSKVIEDALNEGV